jgi:hypothetical protein
MTPPLFCEDTHFPGILKESGMFFEETFAPEVLEKMTGWIRSL